jgi:hypothetical protein
MANPTVSGKGELVKVQNPQGKEKEERRGNKKAVHIPSKHNNNKRSTNHCPTGRGTPTHSTAQVYTLQPTTTTSPTPNAQKHARPLLRTQKKTAPAERTGKRQG